MQSGAGLPWPGLRLARALLAPAPRLQHCLLHGPPLGASPRASHAPTRQILTVYYRRLVVHKLPPKEVIVSSFLPVGPLGER